MEKAEIRAAAEELSDTWAFTIETRDDIEAALTAAHTAGGKAEYERGWDMALAAFSYFITTGLVSDWEDGDKAVLLDEIRRLKKGE